MFLEFLNRKIRKHCLEGSCTLITGDRGCGKSTTLSMICEEAKKQGRPVFCQYPYSGAYRIPLVRRVTRSGMDMFDVDKDWLYSVKLPAGSVVLLDEGSTIWPARDFKRWSELDSAFFNFIRKEHISLFIATQNWDQLDLNVKRAASETWHESVSTWFPSFTTIETSMSCIVKVADKNTEVVGKAFKRGARKIVYDICEIPKRNYHLYRKPYYGKFITDFVPFKKIEVEFDAWDDLNIFEN